MGSKVRAGKAVCWRCGLPIAPNQAWDLGHDDDDRNAHRGPEHRHSRDCPMGGNRATLPRMLAKARGEAAPTLVPHDCRDEFDPRGCPECRRRDPTPDNPTTRWSRHWAGGRFDPRCPDCRRRGSACDFALKWAAEESRTPR